MDFHVSAAEAGAGKPDLRAFQLCEAGWGRRCGLGVAGCGLRGPPQGEAVSFGGVGFRVFVESPGKGGGGWGWVVERSRGGVGGELLFGWVEIVGVPEGAGERMARLGEPQTAWQAGSKRTADEGFLGSSPCHNFGCLADLFPMIWTWF